MAAVTLSALRLGAFAPAYAAQIDRLSPAKVKQIRAANNSFKECQKTALGDFRDKKTSETKFKLAVNACRERFPGAYLYVDCKRKLLKASLEQEAGDKADKDDKEDKKDEKDEPGDEAKGDEKSGKAATAACRKYLIAATFDPLIPQPFLQAENQLFFAGIGLNRSLPVRDLDPPNFDCEKVKHAVTQPKTDASFLLFGNHPRHFLSFRKLDENDVANALGIAGPRPSMPPKMKVPVYLEDFGNFYGDLKGDAGYALFPAAACDFDGQLGHLFTGLSAYYLLDKRTLSATPYFAVAYFDGAQKKIDRAVLITQLKTMLGESYKEYVKSPETTYLTQEPFTSFDEEKDPKNVCADPRPHRFIAVVQGQKNNPGQPEYALIANVKNLCEFGDRMARRRLEH